MGLKGFSGSDQYLPVCHQMQVHSPEYNSSHHFMHLCQLHIDPPEVLEGFSFLASQFSFILQLLVKAFILHHHQNNFLIGTYRNKNPEHDHLFIKPHKTVKIIAKVQSSQQDRQQHTDPVGLSNAVLLTTTPVVQAFGQSCVQHSCCNVPTDPRALSTDTTKPKVSPMLMCRTLSTTREC